MRTYHKICACCGAEFLAGHRRAKWCGVNYRVRAYSRRRRCKPEADAHVLGLDDDLPLVWNPPAPAGTEQRFWRGTAIQRRQVDGFVNATAMCQAGGREWFTYARAARTQEYIAALSQDLGSPQNCGHPSAGTVGIPTDLLVQSTTTGPNELRGTWIHPRLAVDLARWISPAFAVWMDGWFLEEASQPPPVAKPLPAPRQLMIGEDPYRLFNLAEGMKAETDDLAEPLLDRLQLIAGVEGLSPAALAIAEEINGTVNRLQRLTGALLMVA